MAYNRERRILNPALLVGSADIGRKIGTSRRTPMGWFARYSDFPRPLTYINSDQPIWYWPEVERWIRSTNRANRLEQGEKS